MNDICVYFDQMHFSNIWNISMGIFMQFYLLICVSSFLTFLLNLFIELGIAMSYIFFHLHFRSNLPPAIIYLLKTELPCGVDRIEIYLTIMDMAGSISIFDNLYRNFDELKIFEKFYDITWQPQLPQMIQKSLQWPP